jgi:hypothetical protein
VLAASIIRPIVAFIALMMEAALTSETSVNLYQTMRRNNPEDCHFRCITCFQQPCLQSSQTYMSFSVPDTLCVTSLHAQNFFF